MADDLREARAAALDAAASGPRASVLHYLRLVRTTHAPAHPLEVYSLTKSLIDDEKLLDESSLWAVREDHAIACIQLGKGDEALSIVNLIHQRFPGSCRAARLKGMYLESVDKADEARTTYEAALHADPDNLMIIHRIVALKRDRGDIAGALEDLHKHLDHQLGDYQAWYEAGRLHARQGAYEKALFCFEEVLMHQPGDFPTHLILADCLCALGGLEHVRLAKKYYASVVEMSGGANVKALFGVCQCVARGAVDVVGDGGGDGGGAVVGSGAGDGTAPGAALGALAAEALLNEYAVKGGPWARAAGRLLSAS